MGTRSTTKIYDNNELILSLYKQYDGYIDGWGKKLKQFIKSGKFVNGIKFSNSTEKQFNGIGCFALQLVNEFKKGVGDIYATTEQDIQEYNYIINYITDISNNPKRIEIYCEEDETYKEIIDLKIGDEQK